MTFELSLDCRHYLGDRPCAFRCRCRCEHFEPMGHRVLIIKLAALGDVVRTACLLPTLKRQYDPCFITWITRPPGVAILTGHPMIDRLWPFDAEGILQACHQDWDLVLCLDKETPAAALCNAVHGADKRGIGLSRWGTAGPLGPAAETYFELGLDDELKFRRNTKTYPQLIHEALSLPYSREPYRLVYDEAAAQHAREVFAPWRAEDKGALVGLNTGSGRAFANKAPGPARWVELCQLLLARGYQVALLGGPDEEPLNEFIQSQAGPEVHLTGSRNSEPQFVAIVDQCDALVTGDTLGLHVAVSQGVPVVALFGPTCPQEIDLFDRGRKIISPVDCSPCYRRACGRAENCMDAISPPDIVAAVDDLLNEQPRRRPNR